MNPTGKWQLLVFRYMCPRPYVFNFISFHLPELWTCLKERKKTSKESKTTWVDLWQKALKASEEWKYKLHRGENKPTSLYRRTHGRLKQLASPAAAESCASAFYYSVGYNHDTRGWGGITAIRQCHRLKYAAQLLFPMHSHKTEES